MVALLASLAIIIAGFACAILLRRFGMKLSIQRALEVGIEVKTTLYFSAPFDPPTLEEGPPCFEERFLEPARWLHTVLLEHLPGIAAPEFVDYAYSLPYSVGSKDYSIELSYDFYSWQYYEVSIEPSYKRGGGRRRLDPSKEQSELAFIATSIHHALAEQDEVTEMRWYDDPPEDPDCPYADRPD